MDGVRLVRSANCLNGAFFDAAVRELAGSEGDHPSRAHARSPALQPRNPKNAAQKKPVVELHGQATSGSAYRRGRFTTSTAADLSCDRAPSICEFAPYQGLAAGA